jgi:hypothetical protein
VATSAVYTAEPNANGSTSADLSAAQLYELPFEVTEKGNYVISFLNSSTGFDEFLLLECRINSTASSGIANVLANPAQSAGIYSPSGTRRQTLQRGLNIIVSADGNIRKVMVK